METNGIAWMIAGGVRAESAEDQRQRQQRVDLAHVVVSRPDGLPRLRERIARVLGGRPSETPLSADCCPA
jgi:hypothetical protein